MYFLADIEDHFENNSINKINHEKSAVTPKSHQAKSKIKKKNGSKTKSRSRSKSPNTSNTSFLSKKSGTSRSQSRSKSPNTSKAYASLQKSRSFSPMVDLISPKANISFKKVSSFENLKKKNESSTKLKEIENKLGAERRLRE